MSISDRRDHPKVLEFVSELPVKTRPLVGVSDLDDLKRVIQALPHLEFPINSAGDLLDKLGGVSAKLDAAGVPLRVELLLKRMPAYYFPISTMENFLEKVAELIRQNRYRYDVKNELQRIHRAIGKLEFPIASPQVLLQRVKTKDKVKIEGRELEPSAAVQLIPEQFFPITSRQDFDDKVTIIIRSRPIIGQD